MKAKNAKQSRWGGARKGAGRHPRSVKSRFTKSTRIDPKWDKEIEKQQGFSFAQKLDALIQKAIDLCKQ